MDDFFFAISQGECSTVKKLLDKGYDIENTDRAGRTGLFYAVSDHMHDIVKLLLAYGAMVNVTDTNLSTPLHMACIHTDFGMTKLLIDAGAKINERDRHGNTPLHYALYHSAGQGDTIRLLLCVGADRDVENNYGVTPYSLACSVSNYDLKQFFDE